MKFPEPTVDIEVIKQKYHAIGQEERTGAVGAETDESERKQGKKGAKKKKKS
jgi:hypothetical protein